MRRHNGEEVPAARASARGDARRGTCGTRRDTDANGTRRARPRQEPPQEVHE